MSEDGGGVHVTSPFRQSGAKYTSAQIRSAWLVHGFTTLGIVAAMLALRDIITGHPDNAILWLLLTLVIDGVDGPVARALEVEKRVPGLDGFLLDLIIDYVTCVVVPACFMYAFAVVPQNNWGIAVLCIMVFTSAIWFSRKDMMTDDYWFRGFPAAWNIIGPVMWVLDTRTWIGAVITLILSLLCLTNMPYPHIARARFMRPVTWIATVCWLSGVAAGAIIWDPSDGDVRNEFVRVLLYAGSAYFVLLAGVKWLHDIRQRRATAPMPPAQRSPAESR